MVAVIHLLPAFMAPLKILTFGLREWGIWDLICWVKMAEVYVPSMNAETGSQTKTQAVQNTSGINAWGLHGFDWW